MINKLINPIDIYKPNEAKTLKMVTKNNQDVNSCATSFLKDIKELDRNKLKNMINKGYFSGENIAIAYGVDPKSFLESLRNLLLIN